jgi:hypothetical protein
MLGDFSHGIPLRLNDPCGGRPTGRRPAFTLNHQGRGRPTNLSNYGSFGAWPPDRTCDGCTGHHSRRSARCASRHTNARVHDLAPFRLFPQTATSLVRDFTRKGPPATHGGNQHP